MKTLVIDNYIISTPILEILYKLRSILTNGKLKDIKPGSSDIVVTCPKHSGGHESNPDCNIYIGDNDKIGYGFAHCFACDFKGTFVRFVQECFDLSEDFAKRWLIENFGELKSEAFIIDDPIDLNAASRSYLDESLLDGYQDWCEYLNKRKLSRDICNKFKVKYDPVYRQIIFPVYDIYGNLKMLAKRSIDTKVFYLDKDQDKEVYALNIIQKNNIKSCMLVEGPIDLLTCYTHNIPAIATLGALSNYQIDNINRSCITCLYIATDNDEAGEKFANILERKLDKRILRTRIQLPKNRKDVNDLTDIEWNNLIDTYNLQKIS